MSDLRSIPNIGTQTEKDLLEMGYTTIESLKRKTAQELYDQECALRGCKIDRCQLYLFRAVEYYVNTEHPDPAKCKWWFWKDDFAEPSPCGAVCTECARFPTECEGCRKIKGRVFWLQYTGDAQCPIYRCCIIEKQQTNCAKCPQLPCSRFTSDPTISEEENQANLQRMIKNLKQKTDTRI